MRKFLVYYFVVEVQRLTRVTNGTFAYISINCKYAYALKNLASATKFAASVLVELNQQHFQ